MKKSRIIAASRKALISGNPEYYSWPAKEQDIFRANLDGVELARVEAVLLKEILGIQCTADDAGKIWSDLPLSKLGNLNWAKLLISGIGENHIYLNESMAEKTTLLCFETLYDYDYDDYLFQQRVNKKEITNYRPRDYYALQFSRWMRLIIDERFYYATLYSLAGYITTELEEKGREIIDELIPNKLIEGKDNGKQESGGFLWDMKIEAGGLERHLDELNDRWHQYLQQRWTDLCEEFKQHKPAVFVEEIDIKNEFNRNYIFTNGITLKHIRWKHYLTDCESLINDLSIVFNRLKQETIEARQYLGKEHRDIMKNFDPSVIKLKKMRKVVIAPGALDGLMGDDD